MTERFEPTRGFRETFRRLDQFRKEDHSIAEKLFCCPLLLGRALALSNLGARTFDTERKWANFVDVYLLTWMFGVILLLGWSSCGVLAAIVAAYQIAMILANQLAVLLIDSRNLGWAQTSLRRTLVLSIVNLVTLTACYAVLFRALDCVGYAGLCRPVTDPLTLFYFSTVTITTLGYGDLLPLGQSGSVVVVAEVFTGFLFLVALIPAVIGGLSTSVARERGMTSPTAPGEKDDEDTEQGETG